MKCKHPFIKGIVPFPCGQCLFCRVSKRRLWTHRILLEAAAHAESSFWTLTYSPENLPPDLSVYPSHVSGFVKRVRTRYQRLGRKPIRFFAVGEYGDISQRPHYHLVLFGVGESCEVARECWPLGHSYGAELNATTAAYVAGYVVKKFDKNHPDLKGRHPEFSRQSLKPGIGRNAAGPISEFLVSGPGCKEILRSGDVPSFLRHGSTTYPLGRYLKEAIRLESGFSHKGAPNAAIQKRVEELRPLREVAGSKAAYIASAPFLEKVKMFQSERRMSIFKKVKKL